MRFGNASDYLRQRRESMRRARNAAFYAKHADTAHARAAFESCARHEVRAARYFNWYAVARLREYSRASAVPRWFAPPHPLARA